jgi:hypothetical protein
MSTPSHVPALSRRFFRHIMSIPPLYSFQTYPSGFTTGTNQISRSFTRKVASGSDS